MSKYQKLRRGMKRGMKLRILTKSKYYWDKYFLTKHGKIRHVVLLNV